MSVSSASRACSSATTLRLSLRQRAFGVEVFVIAFAHETAVAGQKRRIVVDARRRARRPGRVAAAASASPDRGQPCGQVRAAPSMARELAGAGDGRADGGKIARAAAPERQPGQGAGDVGHGLERLRAGGRPGRHRSTMYSTMSSRALMAAGSVRGAASRRVSRRAPAGGDGLVHGVRAASPCVSPRLVTHQFERGARRRIDRHDGAGRRGARAAAAPAAPLSGCRRHRRQAPPSADAAGAGEGGRVESPAKAVGDALRRRVRNRTARRATTVRRGRSARGRRRHCRSSQSRDAFGHQQFGRIDAGQFVAERLGRRVRSRKVSPVETSAQARARSVSPCRIMARAARKLLAASGSRSSSVMRAGGDEPHHVALDHRFGAALLGFGRVLDLLADGDAMAEADELLEIVLGGMDRHAAHRDVLALMLAALGQNDAERLRRRFRRPRRTARRNRPCGRTADSRD